MKVLTIATMVAVSALPVAASDRGDDVQKLQKAETVLRSMLDAPDKGIPKEMLEHAECVGVFPDVKKAAFVVGGTGGRGVFTCRTESGEMGAPAFFNIGGGSVGWQFGGQEADLVLLVMNKDGMRHLLQDKFTLGGEASATAGPVGRDARAATDAQLNAQILSWSRSQGLFLGASLSGTAIRPDKDANERLYGDSATAEQILVQQKFRAPKESSSFVALLNKHAERS